MSTTVFWYMSQQENKLQLQRLSLKLETPGDWIETACLLEASARKAGNVHPQATFADLTFADFRAASRIAGKWLSQAAELGIGNAILQMVTETVARTGTNVNLGIALLLAPLAAIPASADLETELPQVLERLDLKETALIYQAIQLARPGGMGNVSTGDVAEPPELPIRAAMGLAAERDRIALQYRDGFPDVLQIGRGRFLDWTTQTSDWEIPIIGLQLELLANAPDSLIARKCGMQLAEEASKRAANVLQAGWPHTCDGQQAFQEYDVWLREDGHRRNPGTTADLIAAILYVVLRQQAWQPPTVLQLAVSTEANSP